MSLIARFSFPSNPVLYTNVPEEPHCAVPRCYGQSSIRALTRLRIAAEKQESGQRYSGCLFEMKRQIGLTFN